MTIWNIILELVPWEEYHPWNISVKLNNWGIMDIFKCTKASVNSDLLDGTSQGVVLLDASTEKYRTWSNPILDKVLEAAWFRLIKIVNEKWESIVNLT